MSWCAPASRHFTNPCDRSVRVKTCSSWRSRMACARPTVCTAIELPARGCRSSRPLPMKAMRMVGEVRTGWSARAYSLEQPAGHEVVDGLHDALVRAIQERRRGETIRVLEAQRAGCLERAMLGEMVQ